jgi:hypothetical protein
MSCDIGPSYTGSIPAAATQAGFTHWAANYDFTQTQQWTDNVGTHQWSNRSSWFTCDHTAGLPYLIYYSFGDNVRVTSPHNCRRRRGLFSLPHATKQRCASCGSRILVRLTDLGHLAEAASLEPWANTAYGYSSEEF